MGVGVGVGVGMRYIPWDNLGNQRAHQGMGPAREVNAPDVASFGLHRAVETCTRQVIHPVARCLIELDFMIATLLALCVLCHGTSCWWWPFHS